MNNSIGQSKELIQLKDLFQELLRILETEGDQEVHYAKSELRKDIQMIEDILNHNSADLNEVFLEVKESYQSMYPPRGGLTDFFIWREDFEERRKANQPLNHIKDELNKILGVKLG
jgi:hypothetical protein